MPQKIVTEENVLNTDLPVQIWLRPPGQTAQDWQEFDRASGYRYIHIPTDQDVRVRIRSITDTDLETLAPQLAGIQGLVSLNLSENRNMTDAGLACLKVLTHLTELNLSSCGLTSTGLEQLKPFIRLTRLDLSYCNRLTDGCIKTLQKLTALTYLDLKGCVKITNGGLSKLRREGLTLRER
jgi:hypothetical protein